MHHFFFIRIPRRIRPLHRSCGPLPPATRGKRRHISAFRNQGRYRLRFFEAHRYTACIGLVEQAGFEPTTCAERSRQTLCAAPTSCATAPCMLNRNCAGAFAGASFTSRGLSREKRKKGCPLCLSGHGGRSRIRTDYLRLCLPACFLKHFPPVSPPDRRQIGFYSDAAALAASSASISAARALIFARSSGFLMHRRAKRYVRRPINQRLYLSIAAMVNSPPPWIGSPVSVFSSAISLPLS